MDWVAISLQSYWFRTSVSANLSCFCFLVFALPIFILLLVQFCSLSCLVLNLILYSSIFLWLYNDDHCQILCSSLLFHVITTSNDFLILFLLAFV